jgi:hypothetical protein
MVLCGPRVTNNLSLAEPAEEKSWKNGIMEYWNDGQEK